jgi:cholesterol transport system auxiliary component
MRELLIILGLLFSGCATVKPTITDYRIFAKTVQNSNSSSNGCKDKSLKIAQAFSPSSLMSLNMDYMESGNRVFSYSQSQWQESPNDAITLELLKNIRSAGIFSSVEASKSRSKSSWLLETNIEEFLQFYTQDMKNSYVNVVVTLTIIDTKTNSVVATKTFSSKADAKTLDAQGGVEALSTALSEVIFQNIEWLERVCK